MLVGLFSAVIGGIAFWAYTRRAYPKTLDEEGATALNGKRYLWKDLQDMKRVKLVLAGTDIRLSGELNMHFSNGTVVIKPIMIDNGNEVFAYLSILFGRTVTSG
jgi:hypothetical protein